MAEKVAVVGPRERADLEKVEVFVRQMWDYDPEIELVSGGAVGVDKTAEQTWLELGGRITSFRVRETKRYEEFSIEIVRLGIPTPQMFVPIAEPTWADYVSALFYRSTLIADYSDRVIAFKREIGGSGWSPGTDFTASYARDIGKEVFEP